MRMSADPGAASFPRRTRLAALLVAVLLVLVAGVLAARRMGSGGELVDPQPAGTQAAEDCEEEPPPTSFTLAECDAGAEDEASSPAPDGAKP
jgi:hypothetical protein